MTSKEMRQTRRAELLNMKSRSFKCEGERNGDMLHYERVFGNVFERRESKCCAVLMKHCRKVKGEQVLIPQMDQQLKTKNISHKQNNCMPKLPYLKISVIYQHSYVVVTVKINFC